MYSFDEVKGFDPEVAKAIELEVGRQNDHIELIASENFVSKAVMAAMGSPLTNKYAEGYPGKRYYGGCDCVDVVENLAINRAKELLKMTKSVKESCFGSGFSDVTYFVRLFKKREGITPGAYMFSP